MGLFGKKDEDDRFISLLVEQAGKTVEGIRILQAALPSPTKNDLEVLRAKEAEADEVRRILIDELHNTFITPLDREDIFNVSLQLDEMIDYALTTMEEMDMLHVDSDELIDKMVGLVRQEAEELHLAMQRLSANPRVAGDHARRAKKIEGDVDHLYRIAVARLYADVANLEALPGKFYRREVYRHISNMSDKADSAANAVGMVVMKLT